MTERYGMREGKGKGSREMRLWVAMGGASPTPTNDAGAHRFVWSTGGPADTKNVEGWRVKPAGTKA